MRKYVRLHTLYELHEATPFLKGTREFPAAHRITEHAMNHMQSRSTDTVRTNISFASLYHVSSYLYDSNRFPHPTGFHIPPPCLIPTVSKEVAIGEKTLKRRRRRCHDHYKYK